MPLVMVPMMMIVVVMPMMKIVLNISIIVIRAGQDVVALMEMIMVLVSMEMLIIMLMVMNRQRHRRQGTLLLTLSSIIPSLSHLLHLGRCCCSGSIVGRILTSWLTLVLAAVARFTMMVPGFLLAPAPEVDEDGDDEGDEDQADGEAGGCGGGYFAVVRGAGVQHGGLVVVVEAGHVEDGEHHGRAEACDHQVELG